VQNANCYSEWKEHPAHWSHCMSFPNSSSASSSRFSTHCQSSNSGHVLSPFLNEWRGSHALSLLFYTNAVDRDGRRYPLTFSSFFQQVATAGTFFSTPRTVKTLSLLFLTQRLHTDFVHEMPLSRPTMTPSSSLLGYAGNVDYTNVEAWARSSNQAFAACSHFSLQ
jgi:hypothetical protein